MFDRHALATPPAGVTLCGSDARPTRGETERSSACPAGESLGEAKQAKCDQQRGLAAGEAGPRPTVVTERSSAWIERCVRDAEVAGSNPVAPTVSQEVSPTGLACWLTPEGRFEPATRMRSRRNRSFRPKAPASGAAAQQQSSLPCEAQRAKRGRSDELRAGPRFIEDADLCGPNAR